MLITGCFCLTGHIAVRDTDGKWYKKRAETTFFPEHWSRSQTENEIKSAFENSKRLGETDQWKGISASGLEIRGFYQKPNGTGTTAWPVYKGQKYDQ